jgi:hypothetical protein
MSDATLPYELDQAAIDDREIEALVILEKLLNAGKPTNEAASGPFVIRYEATTAAKQTEV